MKAFWALLLLVSFNSYAIEKIDLKRICADDPQGLVVFDSGFCAVYLQAESEPLRQRKSPDSVFEYPLFETELKKFKWKIKFYASHSFTKYFDTDVNFKSTRYNIEIKDYEWVERSSRLYFEPKNWFVDGNSPLNMIDEPTNTFVISIEKDGHKFFLSAFHPKFLQKNSQTKYMKGTIDGVEVDTVQEVNKPFDGYDQVPGESEIVGNRNSHKQMSFEIGYGHRFVLLNSKIGSISYVPGIGAGIMTGQNVSTVLMKDQWWEFDDFKDKNRIQGFGGSLTNRVEFNARKERFGVFYENKLGYYHQKHGFLDGTQEYDLTFMGNSIGIKFLIYNPKNKKKVKPY